MSPQSIDAAFSPPIVIRRGGTYRGAWYSSDPKVSAITIETSEPVTIRDSVVVGVGNLIYGRNVNGIIENVSGFGIGSRPGKFLDLTVDRHLDVVQNRMSNVWGIRISGTGENKLLPRLNLRRNFSYNLRDGLETHSHFIQLVGGTFPGAQILENIAINAPWRSHVEDVINIYDARGTPTDPIQIKENKILGAYPPDPANDSFSGGGIIVDGGSNSTPDSASAYVQIENNIVIATTNYGIALAAGNHNSVRGNTIVSSGMVSSTIPSRAQNVGLYIWNLYKQSEHVFFDNAAFENEIHWMKVSSPNARDQVLNPMWLPDCQKEARLCANVVLSRSRKLTDAMQIETSLVRRYFGND
ncbi:hypothetical protein [Bradyrhizobium vignae]|uniref:Right handed beta helix domain-containing protein n=1 Tax=Bradyrhizobium vignae TaxID=1549949 RepID=A0ABS3ZQC6_9BRAD|nr:hypothetical protein [Bradyrhizobium vignae]MBP0110350.1 hypothetical protein [Bradyrhizobium vignae]